MEKNYNILFARETHSKQFSFLRDLTDISKKLN